mmetsp:Transcript_3360/g.5478  ORF Transcript_3360/g.5478 Transcript_3360/m.5478 type:complete len:201 (-) Transcript_3360:383-985(-)
MRKSLIIIAQIFICRGVSFSPSSSQPKAIIDLSLDIGVSSLSAKMEGKESSSVEETETKKVGCICSEGDHSSYTKLEEDEVLRKVDEHKLWVLADNKKSISRTFVAKNFQVALDFMVAAGALAEEQNHHPDFHLTNYRNVEVVLSTHASDGLTQVDFELAKRLDELPVEYAKKWKRDNAHLLENNNEMSTTSPAPEDGKA